MSQENSERTRNASEQVARYGTPREQRDAPAGQPDSTVHPAATQPQSIRRLLRSRATLRQAILLHEILGPPGGRGM